jgi:hypothetical protein
MAKPLLPRYKPGTRDLTQFSAADSKSGVSEIKPNLAQDDLIWAQGLRAEGVSHCLAAAEVYRWRLALGTAIDPYCRRVIEFLLQCQFLGKIEFHHVSLDHPPSLLKNVIREAACVDELTLWRLRFQPGGESLLVGARLGTRYPLFPAAVLQDDPNLLRDLAQRLQAASDGAVRWQNDRLQFMDEAVSRRFKSVVARLQTSDVVDAGSPWHSVFADIAEDQKPDGPVPAHHGLIPPDTARDQWICPAHRHSGRSWIDHARGQTITVTAEDPFIRCPAHETSEQNTVIVDASGNAVTVEMLGGAIARTESGVRLYVWEDEQRPSHLIKISSTGSGLTFAYWDNTGPRIRVDGTPLRLADVLTPSIPLPGGNGGASASLGVAPAYLELIAAKEWDRVRKAWRVRFKGRQDATLLPQPGSQQADPKDGVVVWPPVVYTKKTSDGSGQNGTGDPLWQNDLVGLSFGPYCTEAAELVRRPDGVLVERPYRRKPWLGSNDGRVEYVALQRDRQPVGVVATDRPAQERESNRAGYIAIDFGTSNTTVMYKAAGTDGEFVGQGVPDPSAKVFSAVAGPESEVQLKNGLVLFSSWFREREKTRLFGSLLVELAKGERGVAIVPRYSTLLKNFKRGSDSELYGDLKWQDPHHAHMGPLEQYLERALIAALYELVGLGCSSVRVAATYPLAFDNSRFNLYQATLEHVLGRLSKIVPHMRVEPLRLFSESLAGIRASAGRGADATLTIDLGGGTTDLAVVANNQVVAVDSLKIGARGLLGTVLAQGRTESDAVFADLELQNLDVPRAVAIEAALQEHPVARVRLAMSRALATTPVRQAIAASFAAIVVAATALVKIAVGRSASPSATSEEAEAPPGKPIVNVVLLGQGWQLLNHGILGPYDEGWFLKNLIAHAGDSCEMHRTNAPSDFQERKLALARGAMKLVEHEAPTEQGYYDPPILLGMDLTVKDRKSAWPADTRVAGFRVGAVRGDAGFDRIITELWQVMKAMSDADHELGLDDAQLDSSSAAGESLRTRLQNEGVHLLTGDLSPRGNLLASPLMRFLDQCWQRHWAAADE